MSEETPKNVANHERAPLEGAKDGPTDAGEIPQRYADGRMRQPFAARY